MQAQEILEKSRELLPYMKEIRRHLHKIPGVGFDNHETMKYIREKLSENGIESADVGRCGLCATIGNGEKCILLRADTDGLDIQEEADVDFRSQNGKMHACGHDLHTAQLLGAAKILKENESKLGVTVKFMFQSAEENLCGAKDMIDNGILENPKPCMAFMLHVLCGSDLKTGTIIIPPQGESAPSADFFEADVYGNGSHGSSPCEGTDPIYTACSVICALSEINSRELSMFERAILTIGSINAGMSANVIPSSAHFSGTLRCFGEGTAQKVKKRLCEITQSTAKTFRTTAEVRFTSGCPSLKNDGEVCEYMYERLTNVLGKDFVKKSEEMTSKGTTSGSEDFSYISHEIPSIMLALAAGRRSDGYIYPLHHPKVTFDEEAMIYGCAALVSAVTLE